MSNLSRTRRSMKSCSPNSKDGTYLNVTAPNVNKVHNRMLFPMRVINYWLLVEELGMEWLFHGRYGKKNLPL
jgi:hypothetical protein